MRRIVSFGLVCLLGLGFGCGTDVPEEDESGFGEPRGPIPNPFDPDGDDGDDTGDPDFSIEATPESFNVPQGGVVTVSVKIERTDGFGEAVEVRIDGLPAGVSATTLALGPEETAGSILVSAPLTVGVPTALTARVRGYADAGTRSDEIELTVRGAPGAIDASFGDLGKFIFWYEMWQIDDVDVDPKANLVFTGRGDMAADPLVCRVTPSGKFDGTFGDAGCAPRGEVGASLRPREVVLANDGIFVIGAEDAGIVIARYHQNGVLDSMWGDAGVSRHAVGTATSVDVHQVTRADGGFLIAGAADTGAFLFKLDASSAPDASFGEGGLVTFPREAAYDVVRADDGRWVVLAGTALHAFLADGSSDLAFGNTGELELGFFSRAMTIESGELLVASDASSGAGDPSPVIGLYRLSADTGVVLDTYPAFDVTVDGEDTGFSTRDLVIADDGAILHGGSRYLGENHFAIGRRHPTGAIDGEFGTAAPGVSSHGLSTGIDLEILHDGRYVLGGSLDSDAATLIRVWD